MVTSSVVDEINKRLKLYGLNGNNQPIFRVVFSDDQREVRSGTFEERSGNIITKIYRGEAEVPKYPAIKGKWILERWASPELSYHPDIRSTKNGDYICVYIYQDRDYNYLPPLLKVAEIIVHHLLHPRDPEQARIDDEIADRKEEESEETKIYEKIKTDYEKTATEAENILVGYVKEKTGTVQTLSKLNRSEDE